VLNRMAEKIAVFTHTRPGQTHDLEEI
jgi:hypothetical protein